MVGPKCHCGGSLVPQTMDMKLKWGKDGKKVKVRDVPVLVCSECGHQLLESETVQMLEEKVRARAKREDGTRVMLA